MDQSVAKAARWAASTSLAFIISAGISACGNSREQRPSDGGVPDAVAVASDGAQPPSSDAGDASDRDAPEASFDDFIPIRITSLDDHSRIRTVIATGYGRGAVTGSIAPGSDPPRPELLLIDAQDKTLRATFAGSWEDPGIVTLSAAGENVVIDEGGGRVIYTDKDGQAHTYNFAGTGEMSQAQSEREDADGQTVGLLESLIRLDHDPKMEPLRKVVGFIDGILDFGARKATEVKEAFQRAAPLYTEEPIGEELAADAEPKQFAEYIDEASDRAALKEPATRLLPEDVSTPAEEGSEELVPTTWEPFRVRCLKDFRSGDYLAMEEHACAPSKGICEALGGTAFESPVNTCDQWCRTFGGGTDIEFGASEGTLESLVCYRRACVSAISPPETMYRPLVGQAACDAGCVHKLCEKGPPDSPESCKAFWSPLLYGHTWKVTRAIVRHSEGNGNYQEVDQMVKTDGYSSYTKEWSFEITAEGRVRERYITVNRNSQDGWEESPEYDSWAYNPQFATDSPRPFYFDAPSTTGWNMVEYCAFGVGYLISIDGATLTAWQERLRLGEFGPLVMTLERQ